MAGHSHWAGIKHKKALVDAKRGRVFSQHAKNIMSAARTGGASPDMNLQLRYAIDAAKASNMPKDSIERAVLKGSGQLPGVTLEDITYEGYGPGGAAVLAEVLTDSRNRAAAEIRNIFEVSGGNLAGSGSVAWMFKKKGLITIEQDAIGEDELMELALDAGADDIQTEEGIYEITCAVEDFQTLRAAITDPRIEPTVAELSQIPQNTVQLDVKAARQMLRMMDALEENDDVQHAYSNFDLPQEVMAEMADES